MSTKETTEAVEHRARELCAAAGVDPDQVGGSWDCGRLPRDKPAWELWREDAEEALELKRLRARVQELEAAGRELLSGHDNLYRAHWAHLPTADPNDDLAAKPMREALGASDMSTNPTTTTTEKAAPIPVNAAKEIARAYGYDQVIVIARAVGEGGGEHVTTYGRDQANCDVAARTGDFLKHKIMGWPQMSVSGMVKLSAPRSQGALYLAAGEIAQISEAGASQAWHHVRANIRMRDGKQYEVCEDSAEVERRMAEALR